MEEHYLFLCVGKSYKLMDNQQLAPVCVNTSFESFFGAHVLGRTRREVWYWLNIIDIKAMDQGSSDSPSKHSSTSAQVQGNVSQLCLINDYAVGC